jgi:dinuclear metal center YbgI/SA1388 family protein
MKRDELTQYLDNYLNIKQIIDSSKNGLQVEGPEEIKRIAFAVDSSLAGFRLAVERGAGLLIVHHGLFWGNEQVLTGRRFQRIKTLIEGRVGLYAAHLPLDVHDEVGNNIELARILSLEVTGRFGDYHGVPIGIACNPRSGSIDRDAFVDLANARLHVRCVVQDYGPSEIRTIGVCSGAAADMIDQAASGGFDLFFTGETNHTYAHAAEEHGINAVYAGHYATETVGLKALAGHLASTFGVETVFIDLPTGM